MRIYNATNSQISLPFPGGRLDIPAHSISGNVGANTEVITLLVSAYSADEIAFVVSGPFELNLCSSIPTVPMYVVQSLEEALAKFHDGENKKEVEKKDPKAKTVRDELPAEKEEVKTAPADWTNDVDDCAKDERECECEDCEDCEDECEICECEDEVEVHDYSKEEEKPEEEPTEDKVELAPEEEPEPEPLEEKVETREEKRERVFGHRPNNFNKKKHNN